MMQLAGSNFELKSLDDSGAIEGILAGFGNVDHGGDVLVAGCLSKSLASRKTPLPFLLFHDHRRPIGAWREFAERGDGLFAKGQLALGTPDADQAYRLVKADALTGLSIGWTPKRTAPGNDGERLVVEGIIHEASLVACPMNERARVVEVKEYASAQDIADLLHAGGMPSRQAKVAAGAAWRAINEANDPADEAKAISILKASIARINAIGGKQNERRIRNY